VWGREYSFKKGNLASGELHAPHPKVMNKKMVEAGIGLMTEGKLRQKRGEKPGLSATCSWQRAKRNPDKGEMWPLDARAGTFRRQLDEKCFIVEVFLTEDLGGGEVSFGPDCVEGGGDPLFNHG